MLVLYQGGDVFLGRCQVPLDALHIRRLKTRRTFARTLEPRLRGRQISFELAYLPFHLDNARDRHLRDAEIIEAAEPGLCQAPTKVGFGIACPPRRG